MSKKICVILIILIMGVVSLTTGVYAASKVTASKATKSVSAENTNTENAVNEVQTTSVPATSNEVMASTTENVTGTQGSSNDDKTSNSVLKMFNWLESILGNELFEKTFPIILTDNGSEFSNPLSLEFNDEGISRTRIFFCNPGASYQKGALEKNHEFIRYVIPKGFTIDNFTQNDITKMINHINSLTRPSLNNATPYDLAQILLHKDVLKKLNLVKVPAKEIQLNKKLLKKN